MHVVTCMWFKNQKNLNGNVKQKLRPKWATLQNDMLSWSALGAELCDEKIM